MDFHTLSRKELQAICKKNKIPANITNVAMAEALAALPQVEGLDEFLNPTEAEGGVEEENKDANVPVTPAMMSRSRRRVPAVSTRRKKETEMLEDDDKNGVKGKPTGVPKTPAAAPSSRRRVTGRSVCTKTETPGGTSVQQACSTRRSIRLLQKDLSKMGLMDKIDNVSEELSNVSQQQEEDSAETEKGDSLQTVSTVVSENTDSLEVSSLENNTSYECQSHGSGSEVQLVSGTENDAEAGLQIEPREEGLGKFNYLEAEEVYDAGASSQTGSAVVLDNTDELEVSSLENNTGYQCQPHDSGSEVQLISGTENDVEAGLEIEPQEEGLGKVNDLETEPHDPNLKLEESSDAYDDSNEAGSKLLSELVDSCDSSELEDKECLGAKQDALSVRESEDAFMEVTDQDIAGLTVEVSQDDVVEVTVPDIAGLTVEMSQDDVVEVTVQDIAGLTVEVSQDDVVEVTVQDIAPVTAVVPDDASMDVTDQDVAGSLQNFEPIYGGDEKAADDKDLSSEEVLELGSSIFCSSVEHREEELEAKSEQLEDEAEMEKIDNASDVTGASSAIITVENDASSEKACMEAENFTLESSLVDAGVNKEEDQKDNSEKLEAEAQAEELAEDTASSAILAVEKDASSENSIAVVGVCSESSADEKRSTEAENVAVEEEQKMSVPSLNSNTLVDGYIAIPEQESRVSAETMTAAPVHEQKTSNQTIQSVVSDQLKGDVANEIQTVPEMIMKENLTGDELQKKSMRKLKKMLKNLTLDGKSNCNTDNVVKVQEVERKRTALQALPLNRMTTAEAQKNDAE